MAHGQEGSTQHLIPVCYEQIPTECLLDQLQSTLSQEGMLRIEAPKKQKALKNVKKVKIEVKH